VVAQALPKGDHGPLAVDLMTEGGVDVIVPWAARRCVTRWEGARGERALARWRAAAAQAAKQSRRAWLPGVTGPVSTGELAVRAAVATLAVLLDPAGPVALRDMDLPGSGDILVIVGPEGGVSPEETTQLTAAGAVAARLGPTVLRTSSAGLVAATVLASRTGRWG
jgi:16S rRNA (uracil1498-N3)-methyltransferase